MPRVPSDIIFESYALKSTFFYESLSQNGYFDLCNKLRILIVDQGQSYTWKQRSEWSITDKAWEIIANSGLDPLLVFCHPKIISIHPIFLRYYRCIALLPIKGYKAIAKHSPETAECNGSSIPDNKMQNIVHSLNSIISLVIEMSDGIDSNQINGMLYATAGASIDGSWRNKIGFEGERIIRSLIVQSLFDNKELVAITDKKDNSILASSFNTAQEIVAIIGNIKALTTINNYTVFFSSEPDVRFLNSENDTIGSIEIKAGLDPAGALERLGAMFKSFDNIIARYPSAKNILVASCITDEVQARLNESRSVYQNFILTDIIGKRRQVDRVFINRIRGILDLIESNPL